SRYTSIWTRKADRPPRPWPTYYFFRCPGPHRDLHSFPTRRSSDLDRQPGIESEMTPRPRAEDPQYRGSGKLHDKVALITGGDSRSEEHTSELQSLAYLVCRLLLEKKKEKKELQYQSHHNTRYYAYV